MTLNSYLFEDEKEESSKPIGRYPVPYKKDLPFDIVELMEEMEKKVRYTLLQGASASGHLHWPQCDRQHCLPQSA